MARGHLANGGRDGKRQAEEGGFAPWRANRTTLHLLASKSSESRSEEDQVVTGRGVDEQAQKDAWEPRGWEPALQSASVSSASVLGTGPEQAEGWDQTGQASLGNWCVLSGTDRSKQDSVQEKREGGRVDRQTERGDRKRETERERKERRREGETERKKEGGRKTLVGETGRGEEGPAGSGRRDPLCSPDATTSPTSGSAHRTPPYTQMHEAACGGSHPLSDTSHTRVCTDDTSLSL